MSAPMWTRLLLRVLAPPHLREGVLGDLEEVHKRRLLTHGPMRAGLATSLEALDMARALLMHRMRIPSFSWLDFKLGFRMLVRYPGLTLIGVPAIAFAVVVSVGTFEFIRLVVNPTLPLDAGHRVVGLLNWDVESADRRIPYLHDFVNWREELHSVEELGAFRQLRRNLITREGSEPVVLAEITASGFVVPRVPPLLGRALNAGDEREGAAMVLVIGYDLWRGRFGGDPEVIGETVRLGAEPHTVVGVMPEGFAFPIAHSLWRPMRLQVVDYERGQAPRVSVFGRLSHGILLEEAQAELTALGLRAAADYPETHGRLHPEVLAYPRSVMSLSPTEALMLRSFNIPLLMLIFLVCGNVASLMFARAASRESEIVVRSALGASRGRIVTQMVTEALVLSGIGAVLGVAATGRSIRWALAQVQEDMVGNSGFPFWFTQGISVSTLLYAGVLVLIGAVIMGVLPALKVTGPGVEAGLKRSTAGGGLAFGGVWTAILVAQVAVTVTFPVVTYIVRRDVQQIEAKEVPFPDEEYLVARLEMDNELPTRGSDAETPAEARARFARNYQELADRLTVESRVTGVTFADRLPLQYHPHRRIELDDGAAEPEPTGMGYRVSSAAVATDFLETLGVAPLTGRAFVSGDAEAEPAPVVVNESFVALVLGGRNPLGRRLRYRFFEESGAAWAEGEEPGPWHEIVGVVPDMATATEPDPKVAGIYQAALPGDVYPAQIAVHVVGDPNSFAPRLHEVAAAVDPRLRLVDVMPLSDADRAKLESYAFWTRVTLVGSGVALILSLAGIYAIMSFAVSRKTREIGIRVALGSNQHRVLARVFRRPALQVTAGVAVGAVLSGAMATLVLLGEMWPNGVLVLLAYSAIMMGVCMLACVVPTWRALAIEPAEALRVDG